MKPQIALPWGKRSDAVLAQYDMGLEAIELAHYDGEEYGETVGWIIETQDANYAIHAANLYPRLVDTLDALCDIASAEWPDEDQM